MRAATLLLLVSMLGLHGEETSAPKVAPDSQVLMAPRIVMGIGAVVKEVDGKPVIADILPTGGAIAAGLQKGDVIVEVDGKKTDGLNLAQVVQLIRGPDKSVAHLMIARSGAAPTLFRVVRTPVTIPKK